MKVRGIIFDLDGTLLDTIEDLSYSVNIVLSRHQFSIYSAEAYKSLIGDGLEQLLRKAIKYNCSDELIASMVEEVKQEYARYWMKTTRPYPGILNVLQELVNRNVLLAVFSNKVHEFTVQMVNYYFSNVQFVAIIGLREGIPRKPDPYGAYVIAEMMQLPSKDIAIVGDGATDIEMAKHAGMRSFAVSWGYRSTEELSKMNPDVIIKTPHEILMYI